MSISHGIRFLAAILLCVALTGCDVVEIGVGVPPGGRRWVVTVENQSPRPAQLFVAEDRSPMGAVVGTADPSVVPPGAIVDVAFGVPAVGMWAIFVNPGPNIGALVVAPDVPPAATGKMPFKIVINADGSPGAQVPGGLPGWFGN